MQILAFSTGCDEFVCSSRGASRSRIPAAWTIGWLPEIDYSDADFP